MTIGIGLRAQPGGAAAVALLLEDGEPRVLASTRLETSDPGDRLSLEPYRVAHEMLQTPGDEATARATEAIAEGRRRQEGIAERCLQALAARVGAGPAVAALLVNRAGWMTDLVDYVRTWPEHAAVADGLAVRDALRIACRQAGIEVVEMDEKSLPGAASMVLGRSAEEIETELKALGPTAGRPWRKQQRLACLAAWVALDGRG